MGYDYTESMETMPLRAWLAEEEGWDEANIIDIAKLDQCLIYVALLERKRERPTVTIETIILREGLGYKCLSEGAAVASYCPTRLLDLLSPSGVVDVLRWRLRCRAYNYHTSIKRLENYHHNNSGNVVGRKRRYMERLTRAVYHERAALDQALLSLSIIDTERGVDYRGDPISSMYYVKCAETPLEDGRMHVVFEGLHDRVGFYIKANTYMRWPEACYPTVADYAAMCNLVPAPPLVSASALA